MVTAGYAPWLIFLPTIIALNSNSTRVRPRELHPVVNEPARSENLTYTSSRSLRAPSALTRRAQVWCCFTKAVQLSDNLRSIL